METLPWSSVACYCCFGVGVYYQRIHAQDYPGEGWQKLGLTGMAFLGMLTGFFYLVYCGWLFTWWTPVMPLGMSVLATIPAILVERLVGRLALCRLAVVVWPLCAYLMFRTLPG